MSITFPCPDCDNEIAVPKLYAHVLVCPHCQAKFEAYQDESEVLWPRPTWVEWQPSLH